MSFPGLSVTASPANSNALFLLMRYVFNLVLTLPAPAATLVAKAVNGF